MENLEGSNNKYNVHLEIQKIILKKYYNKKSL